MSQHFNNLNDEVAQLISQGAVGVLPTDTVYGLVCAATNEAAVKRLYKLKNRNRKPGTVIAADINQLIELGIKHRYIKPIELVWPGPISVVLPHHISYLSQSVGSQPFRIPDDPKLLTFLLKTGPLLTSSANQPSEPVSETIEQAEKYFQNAVDFYVNGGVRADRQASTIIQVIDDSLEILREGDISKQQIEAKLYQNY